MVSQAHREKYAGAKSQTGIMYELSQGAPQSYKEALRWYHKAAKKGIFNTQCNPGRIDRAVKPWRHAPKWQRRLTKIQKALHWHYIAPQQGNADAQYQLEHIIVFFEGSPRNFK
jgi:TPR repeat protein